MEKPNFKWRTGMSWAPRGTGTDPGASVPLQCGVRLGECTPTRSLIARLCFTALDLMLYGAASRAMEAGP
jgi:hypothetical protein